MKKIMTLSIVFVLLAFWTHPCPAGNIAYYAPDGRQITKAEYDRLVAGQAQINKNLKKTRLRKPVKKSPSLISATKPKAVPVKFDTPKSATAPRGRSSKISESDIRKIVNGVLESTNKRETDALLRYLAPSYEGTLKTESEQMSLNRKEYTEYLEDGWSGYGFYRARKEGEKINISPDQQKASLETDIIEVASLTNGLTIKLRSHQKWNFEIIDGQILITSTEAEVKEL